MQTTPLAPPVATQSRYDRWLAPLQYGMCRRPADLLEGVYDTQKIPFRISNLKCLKRGPFSSRARINGYRTQNIIACVIQQHAPDKHGSRTHACVLCSAKLVADLKWYCTIHHDGIPFFETDPSAASQESPSTGTTTLHAKHELDFRKIPKVERETLAMHTSEKHPPTDKMLHTEGSIAWIGPNFCWWLPGPTLVPHMYRTLP